MTLHTVSTALYAVAVPCVIAILLPRKKHTIEETDRMLSELPADRFEPMIKFIEQSDPETGSAFWVSSGKLHGTRARIQHMYVLIRAIHSRRQSGKISKEKAEEIFRMAAAQLFYSFLAVPEAFICWLFPALPHICARAALMFHWRASLSAVNAYLDSSPFGMPSPRNLFL